MADILRIKLSPAGRERMRLVMANIAQANAAAAAYLAGYAEASGFDGKVWEFDEANMELVEKVKLEEGPKEDAG